MNRFGQRHLIWTFILGLAGGTALGLNLHRWCRPWGHGRGDPTPRLVERFGRQLTLAPEQKRQLTVILEGTHRRFTALRGDVHPKFEAIRRETDAAIEKILTPEQVTRYRELRRKRDAHRARLHRPPPLP